MTTKTTKILHKRGAEASLPTLDASELAFTTDSQKVFIGTGNNNIELAKAAEVQQNINSLSTSVTQMSEKVDAERELSMVKSNKDENGVFTTVTYKRPNGTIFGTSVLSGGTSPQYTTRTESLYNEDGTSVVSTKTFSLSYDTDGDLVSEV